MVFRIAMLALLALGLAACQSSQTTSAGDDSVPVAASIQRSPDAGPGSRPISVARAEEVFTDLCVSQAPGFSGTEAVAASYGFVQNTVYGTYYHPRENLSVKLVRGDCSMAFASSADPGELERALTSLAAPGSSIRFEQAHYINGTQYYNVRIG